MSKLILILRWLAGAPRIVCFVGSTKFQQAFEQANIEWSYAGWIVLTVANFTHAKGINLDEVDPLAKQKLNALYLHKIDLANVIYVINIGGYIGESARAEIAYAKKRGKLILYAEPLAYS